MNFLRELIAADEQGLLYAAVWRHFPRSIRVFLDNKYVFQPFWDFQTGRITEDEWESGWARARRRHLEQRHQSQPGGGRGADHRRARADRHSPAHAGAGAGVGGALLSGDR